MNCPMLDRVRGDGDAVDKDAEVATARVTALYSGLHSVV
jgi:hypothetical protein